MIKIMVVEACHLMRIGLMELLASVPDFKVSAGAYNAEEAIQITRQQSIDVMLTDLELPDLSGVDAVGQILAHSPNIKIIALTAYADECSVVRFLGAGGQGYLTKDASLQTLAHAIRSVAEGQQYLDPKFAQSVAFKNLPKSSKRFAVESLARRELEIMKMITRGMGVSAIAQALRISPKSVNFYRYQLHRELGVKNDIELALAGMRMGVLEHTPLIARQKSAKILHLSLVPKSER